MSRPGLGDFESLSPADVADAAEAVVGARMDGTLVAYPSYVNRVYGLRAEDGSRWIAKFYRPGRWTEAALRDEHAFVGACAAAGLPVLPPLPDAEGETLSRFSAEGPEGDVDYYFCVYPFVPGRGWEADDDEGWLALGRLAAGIHAVGADASAPARTVLGPDASARPALRRLLAGGLVHPDCRAELAEVAEEGLAAAAPLFGGVPFLRLHGDLHRGNVLRSGGEASPPGPLVIDFDDMATGPAVQDLWLFLPGRLAESRREAALLLEGYREVRPFDADWLSLVEPLRFLRMLGYLDWQARQKDDHRFAAAFPDWGTRSFWIKEVEDLRDQAGILGEA